MRIQIRKTKKKKNFKEVKTVFQPDHDFRFVSILSDSKQRLCGSTCCKLNRTKFQDYLICKTKKKL